MPCWLKLVAGLLVLIGFGCQTTSDYESPKSTPAQHNLGYAYLNGEGVAQDDGEAVKWYRKAADQGHAEPQHNLGGMYYNGHGVPKNYVEAVKWFRKAAEQGYAFAQLDLGLMYGRGYGVAQDDVQAYKWLNLAAAKGNEQAKKNRTIIAKKMTKEQIAEAQKLASEFKPSRKR